MRALPPPAAAKSGMQRRDTGTVRGGRPHPPSYVAHSHRGREQRQQLDLGDALDDHVGDSTAATTNRLRISATIASIDIPAW